MYFTKLSVQLLYDALSEVQCFGKNICSIHVAPECYDIFKDWITVLQIPESYDNLWGIPIYKNDKVKPSLIVFICGDSGREIPYDSVKEFFFYKGTKRIRSSSDVFGLLIGVS